MNKKDNLIDLLAIASNKNFDNSDYLKQEFSLKTKEYIHQLFSERLVNFSQSKKFNDIRNRKTDPRIDCQFCKWFSNGKCTNKKQYNIIKVYFDDNGKVTNDKKKGENSYYHPIWIRPAGENLYWECGDWEKPDSDKKREEKAKEISSLNSKIKSKKEELEHKRKSIEGEKKKQESDAKKAQGYKGIKITLEVYDKVTKKLLGKEEFMYQGDNPENKIAQLKKKMEFKKEYSGYNLEIKSSYKEVYE